MTTLLTVIHILVCLFIIAVVLLQHGKGADSGAFTSGQAAFGPRDRGSPLSRITMFAASIFMISCLVLAYRSAHESNESVFSETTTPAAAATVVAGSPTPLMSPTPEAQLTPTVEGTPSTQGTPKK